MIGIQVTAAFKILAEENIINDCAEQKALSYSSCTNFESFNNQTTDALLMHAYDASTARRRMELQDIADDLILGI